MLPPALPLLLSGILLYWSGPRLRVALILLSPLASLFLLWSLPAGYTSELELFGHVLAPLAPTPFSYMFVTIFSLAALAGGIYGLHASAGPPELAEPFAPRQNRRLELASAYWCAGSAVGIVGAGDLLSLFVYWELMTLGSTLVIWSADTPQAHAAGIRYALLHFVGGVVLLAGIALQATHSGSLALPAFSMAWDTASPAAWLLSAGVLINAAAPPLSAWLPDAYPEASPGGMVFISAFTTKSAVYVLLAMFAGSPVLVHIGLFMIGYGLGYAFLQNDIRRFLAYNLIGQMGLLLTGIGAGTAVALQGVAAYAAAHIAYKGLLVMVAGSVIYTSGKRTYAELGGLARAMPWTAAFAVIGALASAAFPLSAGFVSKALIVDGIGVHPQFAYVKPVLVAAAAVVVVQACLFVWLIFFRSGQRSIRAADPPFNMRLGMALLALLCILPGMFPALLYTLLPGVVDANPNTLPHIFKHLLLVLPAGAAFVLFLPWLQRHPARTWDFDWLYRVALRHGLESLERFGNAMNELLERNSRAAYKRISGYIYHTHGTRLGVSRAQAIGVTALWIAVLLGTYLALG